MEVLEYEQLVNQMMNDANYGKIRYHLHEWTGAVNRWYGHWLYNLTQEWRSVELHQWIGNREISAGAVARLNELGTRMGYRKTAVAKDMKERRRRYLTDLCEIYYLVWTKTTNPGTNLPYVPPELVKPSEATMLAWLEKSRKLKRQTNKRENVAKAATPPDIRNFWLK